MTSDSAHRGTASWVVLPALFAAIFIGVLDHFVGVSVTLAPFYLLPVAVVAWRVGRWPAVALAVVCSTASLVGDLTNASVTGLTPYWNAAVRLPVFIAAGLLVDRLRSLVESERAATDTISHAAVALREANELKTVFMQAVAHDVRSPVAAILGAAVSLETIADDLDSSDRRTLIQSLVSGSLRLRRMLDDLLDLERFEVKQHELRYEQIDVDRLLGEICTESGLTEDHPIIAQTEGTIASVDRVLVERIAFNLATNISSHVPAGAPVWIRASQGDGTLIFSFSDAGPGIAHEAKERIFQAFERGVASTSAGAGMGLALVARFATLHGGRAWVEDRPGGGASFHVELSEGWPNAAATA